MEEKTRYGLLLQYCQLEFRIFFSCILRIIVIVYGIYQMMYLFVDALELTIEMYTKYLTESIVINHRASKAKLAVEVHEL